MDNRSYDRSKIGRLIAWGGDHTVYEYGHDHVIKFSIIDFLLGKKATEKFTRDYTTSKTYLADYILESQVYRSPNGKRIAVVQPKVTGHYVCAADLHDEEIKQQFNDIVERSNRLFAEKHAPIDLVGRPGLTRICLSNIFVTPDKKLKIIDTTLVEFAGSSLKFLDRPARRIAVWRQNHVIKKLQQVT